MPISNPRAKRSQSHVKSQIFRAVTDVEIRSPWVTEATTQKPINSPAAMRIMRPTLSWSAIRQEHLSCAGLSPGQVFRLELQTGDEPDNSDDDEVRGDDVIQESRCNKDEHT